jgi:hypothetical protein
MEMTALAASASMAAASVASDAAAHAVFGPAPPVEVMAWACFGGLVAVWLARKDEALVITPRWIVSTLMLFVVCVGSGIALSAGALSLAHAGVMGMAWLASVPHWVMAAVISGSILWAAPLGYGVLRARFGHQVRTEPYEPPVPLRRQPTNNVREPRTRREAP